MDVTAAQLPPPQQSADRIFITPHACIQLDGASAFTPQPVTATAYAERLGHALAAALTLEPAADLREVLAAGIERTADELGLTPGRSPSSTLTIVRERSGRELDILLLGDNVVILPDGVRTDDRMDRLDLAPRRAYRQRLADGHGYDDQHRELLRELQTVQAKHRNCDGGYWIAEADPSVAHHAPITRTDTDTDTAILATDGAYNTLRHLGLASWEVLATAGVIELHSLLDRCQRWEAHTDPHGRQLPRAKRHDDKALAVVRTMPV